MAVTASKALASSVSPRSPYIEQEKWRRLASPNKDISPPNKSMLTVCLHRLGDSPAIWFLIRHMMRRREIGIWAEDCCMGQTDFIVFAFHLPALMETILIYSPHCHPCSKPSQVENTCISHSYFNKPQQLLYIDGERLYFLCWLNWLSTSLLQRKQKMMKTIIKLYIFALYFMKVHFRVCSGLIHAVLINLFNIHFFITPHIILYIFIHSPVL